MCFCFKLLKDIFKCVERVYNDIKHKREGLPPTESALCRNRLVRPGAPANHRRVARVTEPESAAHSAEAGWYRVRLAFRPNVRVGWEDFFMFREEHT